jgi:hypothetical protein
MVEQIKIIFSVLIIFSILVLASGCGRSASQSTTNVSFSTPILQTNTSSTNITLNSKISTNKAISIASAYVPQEALARANLEITAYPMGSNAPIAWIVIYTGVFVTSDQLLKYGWKADINTTFEPPDDSYYWIIIQVDADNGDIMYKHATNGPYLGQPPAITITTKK